MAIIQISKIQQRSGDLVDLPQLDEAEFGFAADEKRLFIGKTTDEPENIEVLTSYSEVSFSQVQGSVGNLNIDPLTLEEGQVLAYDAITNAWENRGGNSGGLINLGEVSNLKIDGGAIGYVLETDGTGNLSWQPKGVVTLYIENIQSLGSPNANVSATTATTNIITVDDTSAFVANAAVGFTANIGSNLFINNTYFVKDIISSTELTVSTIPGGANVTLSTEANSLRMIQVSTTVTFTDEFALSDGQLVTITGVTGMTQVNGNNYYLSNLTTTTANLYTDAGLTTPLNSITFGVFPYTSVSNTTAVTNDITVANAALFTVGDPVQFIGNTFGGLIANKPYYILTADVTTPGNITVTETQGSNVEVLLATDSGTCDVYVTGGRAVATVSGGGGGNTGTSANTQILFNLNNVPAGDSKLTFIQGNGQLTLNGNAFVNNLTSNAGNIRGNVLISNVSTGTAPLQVVSTTPVPNLAVETAGTVRNAAQPNITSVGILTSLAVSGNISSGNIQGGNLVSANFITGTLTTAAQPNITSVGTLTGLNINGTVTAVNFTANTGIITGNGSGLTALNASNISTGTLQQARLANSTLTLGNTTLTLGGTTTTVAGLTSVTSTTFVGALTGAATTAGTVTTAAQPNITSVGTLTSLAVTGNISAGNVNSTGLLGGTGAQFRGNVISTGANTTAGTITGNWSLSAGSRLQSTYADLAEYYAADKNYAVGTVLQFGGEHEVTIAGEETNKLAGVVSMEPAYVMNGSIHCEYPIMIALMGRVPVKVIGPVSKGDMLVSAGQGLAKATIMHPKVGTVIGKAIQNKYDDAIGIVEVMVGRY